MENISKITQNIIAVNKINGRKLEVNLIHIGQRKFNCSFEPWGRWHDYSKRGDWELFINTEG